MKKVSRSILPEGHKEPGANEIKSASKVLNGLDTNVLDAIPLILQKWYDCEQLTEQKRNEYLVHYIMDNFQGILKPYIDNFSKTVGLKDIILESLKSSSVTDKISQDIQDQLSSEPIQNEILKAFKAAIRKQQAKEGTSQAKDGILSNNIDEIFDRLTSNQNKETQRYSKEIRDLEDRHTEDIIKTYRKNCQKLIQRSVQNKLKFNGQNVQRNRFEIQNNLTDRVIRKSYKSVLDGVPNAFMNLKRHIGSTFSSLGRFVKGFGSFIWKTVKVIVAVSLVVPIIKGIWKLGSFFCGMVKGIAGFIVSTIRTGFAVVFKTLSAVGSCVKKLLAGIRGFISDALELTSKALDKTFLAFIMTPAGMYTIGYIIGFMYSKLLKTFKGGGLLSIIRRTIMSSFNNIKIKIINMVGGVMSIVKEHVGSTLERIKNQYAEIKENVRDKLFSIYDLVYPYFEGIRVFLQQIYDFPRKHPFITSLALTMVPVIKWILENGTAMRVAKMAKGPLSAIVAGLMYIMFNSVRNLWKHHKDYDYTLSLQKGKILSRYSDSQFKGLLSYDDNKKYELLNDKIMSETGTLNQLTEDLDEIKRLYKDKDRDINLVKDLPEIVDAVFDSKLFPYSKEEKQKILDGYKTKSLSDQLDDMIWRVNARWDKLITLKGILSTSTSSKDLSKRLERLAKIDIGTGDVAFSREAQEIFDESQKREGKQYENYESRSNIGKWFSSEDNDNRSIDTTVRFNAMKLIGGNSSDLQSVIARNRYVYGGDSGSEIQRLLESSQTEDKSLVTAIKGIAQGNDATMTLIRDRADVSRMKKMTQDDLQKYIDELIREHAKEIEEDKKKREKDENEKLLRKIEDDNKKLAEEIEQLQLLKEKHKTVGVSEKGRQ